MPFLQCVIRDPKDGQRLDARTTLMRSLLASAVMCSMPGLGTELVT